MTRKTVSIPLPTVAPGTRRTLTVHRWGTPGARPKVYLHAALHADEWPGLLTLDHLGRELDRLDAEGRIAGEIVALPYANPIGLDQSVNERVLGRFSLSDGLGNFNRAWPDLAPDIADAIRDKTGDDAATNVALMRDALRDAVAALPDDTEQQAHRKALLGLSVDADMVLDLHCDWRATLHLYANRDHLETVVELGRDMAVPVVLVEDDVDELPFDDANAAPWRRVRERLELDREQLPSACFAVTVELRGQGDVRDDLAAADAANLLRFLIRRGAVQGDAGPLPPEINPPFPLDRTEPLQAPAAGLVVWHFDVGDRIAAGDTVAELVDLAAPDTPRLPVVARQSGILFSAHVDALQRPGARIGKIAGHDPFERPAGSSALSNR